MARSSPRLPGRDRAINLQLAILAKEWSNRIHHLNSRDSLDRRRVRELVMRLPSSQPDHPAFEQLRDAIDDGAGGHPHAQDRTAGFDGAPRRNVPSPSRIPTSQWNSSSSTSVLSVKRLAGRVNRTRAGRLSSFELLQGGPQPPVLPLHHSRRGS